MSLLPALFTSPEMGIEESEEEIEHTQIIVDAAEVEGELASFISDIRFAHSVATPSEEQALLELLGDMVVLETLCRRTRLEAAKRKRALSEV